MVYLADAPTDSIGTAPSVIRSLLDSLAALRVWCSIPSTCPPPVCALDQIPPTHAIAIFNKLSTPSARRLCGCLTRPRVPQLLLQHSSALRKRAVGLTYAYWSTSVEHSSLQSTLPQLNSETVPEVLTSVKCS